MRSHLSGFKCSLRCVRSLHLFAFFAGSDVADNQVVAQTDVHQVRVPRIVRYDGTPATSSMSRNGRVEAVVEDAPRACKYMWTHGVLTDDPVLQHAPMGVYTVALLSADGAPLPFLHLAAPFKVGCTPDLLA